MVDACLGLVFGDQQFHVPFLGSAMGEVWQPQRPARHQLTET